MCDTLTNLVRRKEWVSCLVLICFTFLCIRSSTLPARPLPVVSGKPQVVVIYKALALPEQTSNSLPCFPLLVSAAPRYFNFFTSFNDIQATCRERWTGFPENIVPQFWKLLILIAAMLHAAAKPLNACLRPNLKEASKTKSSAKNSRLILHFPIITHSSVWLSLSMQFM